MGFGVGAHIILRLYFYLKSLLLNGSIYIYVLHRLGIVMFRLSVRLPKSPRILTRPIFKTIKSVGECSSEVSVQKKYRRSNKESEEHVGNCEVNTYSTNQADSQSTHFIILLSDKTLFVLMNYFNVIYVN